MSTLVRFDTININNTTGNAQSWRGIFQANTSAIAYSDANLIRVANTDGSFTDIHIPLSSSYTWVNGVPTGLDISSIVHVPAGTPTSYDLGALLSNNGVHELMYWTYGNNTSFNISNFFNGNATAVFDAFFVGNDNLSGASQSDRLEGRAGDDFINGGAGNDDLLGGAGNDLIIGGEGNDYIEGGSGNNNIIGGNGSDTISYAGYIGANGINFTLGASGSGTFVTPFGGVDVYSGIENVRGTLNADTIIGNSGNNILTGLGGNDVLNGGAGVDMADYRREYDFYGGTNGINVNMSTGLVIDTLGFTDTLISIEQVRGTSVNDTFIGSVNNDEFYGLGGNDSFDAGAGSDYIEMGIGNDTVNGGAGNDILSFTGSENHLTTGINFTLGAAGVGNYSYTTTLGISSVTYSDIEFVRGTSFDDYIIGNELNNRLEGMAGNDTLDGGLGSGDTARYMRDVNYGATHGVNANLTTNVVIDSFGFEDTLINIENIDGTDFSDRFTGNSRANIFTGNGGNDTFTGLGGNDTIFGGLGSDVAILSGNRADYTITQGNDATGIYFNVYDNRTNSPNGNDVIRDVESLQFNDGKVPVSSYLIFGSSVTSTTSSYFTIGNDSFDFSLTGYGVLVNALDGGNDTVLTGGGNDVIIVGDGNDSISSGYGNDFIFSGNGDNIIFASYGNDTLFGGAGNDTLNGGIGFDNMTGGAGNDVYNVDQALESITEFANEGIDKVYSTISYTLSDNLEELYLSSGNINGTGNISDNRLNGTSGNNVLSGLAGNDTLNALGGNDTLSGGTGNNLLYGGVGNDTFIFDAIANGTNVNRIADFSAGTDKIAIDHTVFGGLSVGAMAANQLAVGSAAITASTRFVYYSTTGSIYYDADGSGVGAAVRIGSVAAQTALSFNDFMVI